MQHVVPVEELRGLARAKARDYLSKSVHPALVAEETAAGWTVEKVNKRSVRLRRPKDHGALLEDRVWTLLYRMGFTHLSNEQGATLLLDPKAPASPKTNIDVVGIDTEVALAIECKSSSQRAKRPQFQEELGKHALIRQRFANAITAQHPSAPKRQVALVMFLFNIELSEKDLARAEAENVAIFNSIDIQYYEDLINHLGPAAKYQFLADIMPNKDIPGLSLTVPAIRTKMGGANCYTFSIHPEYLLKIAYVSHRAKGKASDVDTYQRMIKKTRLNRIRDYISGNGIFPTNIVINFEGKQRFERSGQAENQEGGVLGFLRLRPTFKSAWIIDGQHRLFAYSGHPHGTRDHLAVLAFENLPHSDQARLFIDINGQQKSVPQSLLSELHANLHWDAVDPDKKVSAIASRAVQVLDDSLSSPFFDRIKMSDESTTDTRCITLTTLTAVLQKGGLFIAATKKREAVSYGPLWAGSDSNDTLRRTVFILSHWFNLIRSEASDWWSLGSGSGGGLAMNDGVTACVEVLRSVFQHLESEGIQLITLDNNDLAEFLTPYGTTLGSYLGSLNEEERLRLRKLRGTEGQTTFRRRCQEAIREKHPSFNPTGLDKFLEDEKSQANDLATAAIKRMELMLQSTIVEELRREYGPDDTDNKWWILGVPKAIRLKVSPRMEDDDGARGGRENYFDLIDYRNIIQHNWELLGPIFGMDTGRANASKDKRTAWLNEVNEVRKGVMHASSRVVISAEKLAMIEQYEQRLRAQIAGGATPEAYDLPDDEDAA